MLDLSQGQQDTTLLQEGHWGLGQTLYFMGDMTIACRHLEQSLGYYVSQPLTSQVSRGLAGTQIACLVTAARVRWALGYVDQPQKYTHKGLAIANELAHPFTLGFALYGKALFKVFRREVVAAYEQAELSIDLGREHNFPIWIAWGTIIRGWALARQGQVEAGLAQMQQVMTSYQEMFDESTRPQSFTLLAEVYGLAGKVKDGLDILDDLLAVVERTGGRFWEAELHRLKGELLLQKSSANQTETETCYQQALSIAQNQQAKSWELRAAISLARLWQSQDKHHEAHDLLAPVYGWFTEGVDTPELEEAKALLAELV